VTQERLVEAKLYYPNMQNFTMDVNGNDILCDGEGYLLDVTSMKNTVCRHRCEI